jgi:hypothetical protein
MRPTLFSLLGLVGLLAAVTAVSAVWLVLHEPLVVADAVSTGQYQPLLSTLAQELGTWCRALVRLL